MNIKALLEKIKKLDGIGKLSLIRWALVVLALILIIPCELVSGVALIVFTLLFWGSIIAFLVLCIVIAIKKKKSKMNKSY